MMKRILFFNALVGAALTLQACPNITVDIRQKCSEDGDCDTGLLCDTNKKVCVEYLSCGLKQNGCSGSCESTAEAGDLCATSADCATGQVCADGVCAAASPCAADEFCREGDTGAECRKAGCRVESDCNGGQKCIASECVSYTADTPDACTLVGGGIFGAGATGIKLTAVATKNGVVVPYLTASGVITIENGADASQQFELDGTTAAKAKTGASAGEDTAKAVFSGGVSCTAKLVLAAEPGAGASRVILYEQGGTDGFTPITGLAAAGSNANINLFDSNGQVCATTVVTESPANSGVYMITQPVACANVVGVHVAPAGYSATTVYTGSTTVDVRLPLEKLAQVAGFGAKPSFADFDKEFTNLTKAEIKGAFAGGSLPLGSLLNFNLDLFAGDTARRELSASVLTGGGGGGCSVAKDTDTGNAPLPRALYAALNTSEIGPNCDGIAVRALAGRRTTWSVGTKISLAKATSLISLVPASGQNIDIGKIIAGVIPLFDNFAIGNDTPPNNLFAAKPQADWETYRAKNAAGMQSDNKFTFTTIAPSRRMKFIANFANPGIVDDFYPNAAAGEKLNGMVSVVAANSPLYGIVPLGFGAGFDNNADGKLDTLSTTDSRFGTDVVHTRFASTNKELSDNEIIGVMVATNFTDLTRKTEEQKSGAVRVKGIVSRNASTGIGWSATSPTMGSMSSAVQGVNFTQETYARGAADQTNHVLVLPTMGKVGSTGADVVVVRVSRDGVSRSWNVIVNPTAIGATALKIPTTNVEGAGTTNIVSDVSGEGILILASTALKFNGSAFNFATDLSAKNGKELNTLAGDLASFALYYQSTDRQ